MFKCHSPLFSKNYVLGMSWECSHLDPWRQRLRVNGASCGNVPRVRIAWEDEEEVEDEEGEVN